MLITAVSISEEIVDFASRYDFEVDPEVYNLLSGLAEQQARLLEGSRAVSSTLVICGLGGELYPFQVAGVEYAVAAERAFIADQHRVGAGQRGAGGDKTCNLLRNGPYASDLVFLEPSKPVSLDDAEPFDCSRTSLRHPRELKERGYRITEGGASECCGSNGSC